MVRNKTSGKNQVTRAFSRTDAIVLGVVLIVLSALLVGAMNGARTKARRIDCVGNLKQVASIERMNGGGIGGDITNVYAHFIALSNQLGTPKVLVCPADRSRRAATNWASLSDSNISYFINADADRSVIQMIISGDDHLLIEGGKHPRGVVELFASNRIAWSPTRHGGVGNIAFADGSAQQVSGTNLTPMFVQSATNRLMMP